MRLLTWNINWGKGVASGAASPVDVGAVITTLQDLAPEVALLQEVCVHFPANTDGRAEDQVARLSSAFLQHDAVFAPALDWFQQGQRRCFGMLLLSRYPILMRRVHPLPAPFEPAPRGLMAPRAALEAWLELPGERLLRLWGVHLEYGSARQRRAQLAYLAERLTEPPMPPGAAPTLAAWKADSALSPISPLPRPDATLMLGDFNAPPERLREELPPAWPLHDLWPTLNAGEPHAPTLSVHWRPKPEYAPVCFDYAWACSRLIELYAGARLFVEAATRASDHQPLVLDLPAPTSP